MGVIPVQMCTKNTNLVLLSDRYAPEEKVNLVHPTIHVSTGAVTEGYVIRRLKFNGVWFNITHNSNLHFISLYCLYVYIVLPHVGGNSGR